MTVPKLHHYVPQFYLRRFAGDDGRLWLWDKNQDRTFRSRPGSIAAETHFYYLSQYVEQGDPHTMEKQFADLEDQVARITDQWLGWIVSGARGEKIEIPDINREIVSLFIALQFFRTAEQRDILAAFAEQVHGSPTLSKEERRELHTDLLWNDRTFRTLAARVQESTWLFGKNDTDHPFLTSDNPVAFRTGDNRQWRKAGIYEPGTYVVYPLAPDVVMYCHPREAPWDKLKKFDRMISPVEFDEEMVESENSGQVFNASRFVISPMDHFEARAFAPTIGTDIYKDL